MTRSLPTFAFATLVAVGMGCAAARPASRAPESAPRLDAAHALDRLAFGARPGDRERLEQMGVDQWIAAQLHPETLDESALEARLAGIRGATPVAEAAQARLVRAMNAERQLLEVMTDFWLNHFNVFAEKGADRWLVAGFERDAIRAHALGRFRDLLGATARSPAMLFYLDNWVSAGPSSLRARRTAGRAGLNENYGRELLELHTLGADAGYTQRDVVEVARCFTGWTLERPLEAARFAFDPRMHDPGDKVVLGRRIPAGGIVEGETVLDLLARDARTARRIARKLAQRFVSDDPPASVVDRLAGTFTASDGDVREVLAVLFRSPEFWDPAAHRAKLKTPVELVVSAVRATGAEVDDAAPLVAALSRMGMPLYRMPTPDGWPSTASAWSGPGALLERLAFLRALGTNRLPGVRVSPSRLAGWAGEGGGAPAAVARLEATLLAGEVSRTTHASVVEALATAPGVRRGRRDPVELAVALLLQSPEFQRR